MWLEEKQIIARRCGAKHISKSKFTKHTMFGPPKHNYHSRTTFRSWDVKKIERHSGGKNVFKSKCPKHTILSPLLEVGMWKNGMPLWREAHFQVKMLGKLTDLLATCSKMGCGKMAQPLWREARVQVKMCKTPALSDHFWIVGQLVS